MRICGPLLKLPLVAPSDLLIANAKLHKLFALFKSCCVGANFCINHPFIFKTQPFSKKIATQGGQPHVIDGFVCAVALSINFGHHLLTHYLQLPESYKQNSYTFFFNLPGAQIDKIQLLYEPQIQQMLKFYHTQKQLKLDKSQQIQNAQRMERLKDKIANLQKTGNHHSNPAVNQATDSLQPQREQQIFEQLKHTPPIINPLFNDPLALKTTDTKK